MEKCKKCGRRAVEKMEEEQVVPDEFGDYYPQPIKICRRCGYYELTGWAVE